MGFLIFIGMVISTILFTLLVICGEGDPIVPDTKEDSDD